MAVEVIVKLIDCIQNFTQNLIIFAILLPMLIYGFKSLYLLLKCYLDDKDIDYKRKHKA